jgi:hypothetical protein
MNISFDAALQLSRTHAPALGSSLDSLSVIGMHNNQDSFGKFVGGWDGSRGSLAEHKQENLIGKHGIGLDYARMMLACRGNAGGGVLFVNNGFRVTQRIPVDAWCQQWVDEEEDCARAPTSSSLIEALLTADLLHHEEHGTGPSKTPAQLQQLRGYWGQLLMPIPRGAAERPQGTGTADFGRVLVAAGCGWMYSSDDGQWCFGSEFTNAQDYYKYALWQYNDTKGRADIERFVQLCQQQMSLVPPAGQGWASKEFALCVQDFNTRLVAAYRCLVPEHDLAVIDRTVMAQGAGAK